MVAALLDRLHQITGKAILRWIYSIYHQLSAAGAIWSLATYLVRGLDEVPFNQL
jgi:hypothetical protein